MNTLIETIQAQLPLLKVHISSPSCNIWFLKNRIIKKEKAALPLTLPTCPNNVLWKLSKDILKKGAYLEREKHLIKLLVLMTQLFGKENIYLKGGYQY
jgi:hypothetical protein